MSILGVVLLFSHFFFVDSIRRAMPSQHPASLVTREWMSALIEAETEISGLLLHSESKYTMDESGSQ